MLVGRDAELQRFEDLLKRVWAGEARAITILGDPGVGKTALLGEVIERAEELGFRVLSARCVQSEATIAFGGLSDLLGPVLGLIERLPPPQAEAIQVALALAPAVRRPTRLSTDAACLNLLSAAAVDCPTIVAVDDAQWLDDASAEAILFSARRLAAEPIGVLLTIRPGASYRSRFASVDSIELGGLASEDSAKVLAEACGTNVPGAVVARLQEATSGNPLALLSIASLLDEAQLNGESPLPDPVPTTDAIRRAYGRRIRGLPDPCRRALVIAAVAHSSRTKDLSSALRSIGLGMADLAPAEQRSLLNLGAERFSFHHPLLRSAVYHSATKQERRAAHAALAEADGMSLENRAWHLALAAQAPDESVASALTEAATEAERRGAHAAALEAFDLAARLTPSADSAAHRMVEAATSAVMLGDADRLAHLLDRCPDTFPDASAEVKIRKWRGRLVLMRGGSLSDLRSVLADADAIDAIDPVQAIRTRVDVAGIMAMSGYVAEALDVASHAHASAKRRGWALAATTGIALGGVQAMTGRPGTQARTFEGGLKRLFSPSGARRDGDTLAEFEAAMSQLVGPEWPSSPTLDAVEYAVAAGHTLARRGDYARAERLISAAREKAQADFLAIKLAYVLAVSSDLELRRGRLGLARALATEALQFSESSIPVGAAFCHATLASAAAAMGLADECSSQAQEALEIARRFDLPGIRIQCHAAIGLLRLGASDPAGALEHLKIAGADSRQAGIGHPGVFAFSGDLVSALFRAGRKEEAWSALAAFEERSRETKGPWEKGVVERYKGLLAGTAGAGRHFARSADLLRSISPFEFARTELLWGVVLRRARRRAAARPHLVKAATIFHRIGAADWASQADSALGPEASPRAGKAGANQLTPQEFQISSLAAEGATNREIASRLFLSVKTVEAHLSRVYTKLDLRSRTELTRLMSDRDLSA